MGSRLTSKQNRRSDWFEAKNQKKVAKEKRAKRQEAHEQLMAKQAEEKAKKSEVPTI